MRISEIKETSKKTLKGRVGISLLAEVVDAGLHTVGSLIPVIGSFLIHGSLETGRERIYYKNSQHEDSSIKDLFVAFKENFGETFLAGLLVNIFTLLWSLLFIIPGIVKSYSYSMTYYLMYRNPDLSANEAITLSRKIMDGNKGKLFLMNLSFIGWYLLCLITCGIAAIYVVPYTSQCRTIFFNDLYDQYFQKEVVVESEVVLE